MNKCLSGKCLYPRNSLCKELSGEKLSSKQVPGAFSLREHRDIRCQTKEFLFFICLSLLLPSVQPQVYLYIIQHKKVRNENLCQVYFYLHFHSFVYDMLHKQGIYTIYYLQALDIHFYPHYIMDEDEVHIIHIHICLRVFFCIFYLQIIYLWCKIYGGSESNFNKIICYCCQLLFDFSLKMF